MHLPQAFRDLAVIFGAAGYELVLVGGAVRDLLLGFEPKDLDFATDAHPSETARVLREAGLDPIAKGADYGSIHVDYDDLRYEITTYRAAEQYERGHRRPKVRYGGTLDEDLWRRDLTMNAMAVRPDGELHDPYGGRRDLEQRMLRVPGTDSEGRARAAMAEDPLRVLRVLRYGARYDAEPDQDLDEALHAAAHLTAELPTERVGEEITGLLIAGSPDHGLRLMHRYGLLERFLPELIPMIGCEQQGDWHHLDVFDHTLAVLQAAPGDPLLRWAALAHDLGKPLTRTMGDDGRAHFYHHELEGRAPWRAIAERLRLPAGLFEDVAVLQRRHLEPRQIARGGTPSARALRRFASRIPGHLVDPLIDLAAADAKGHRPEHLDQALDELEALRDALRELDSAGALRPRFPKGFASRVAEAAGIEPGPDLGAAMRTLQDAVIDGRLTLEPTVDDCVRLLNEG